MRHTNTLLPFLACNAIMRAFLRLIALEFVYFYSMGRPYFFYWIWMVVNYSIVCDDYVMTYRQYYWALANAKDQWPWYCIKNKCVMRRWRLTFCHPRGGEGEFINNSIDIEPAAGACRLLCCIKTRQLSTLRTSIKNEYYTIT